MFQKYVRSIFVGCEQQHQFQITPATLSLKATHTHPASSLKALLFHSPSSLSCYLSPPAHPRCLPRPLLQTHTGPRWCYTLWAWWTYTSEIRALRQSLEHPDTLGWAERLTDWLTLLDGRSELLFCSHCAETRSWVLQLWAFKEEEIAENKPKKKKNPTQTDTALIWFPAVLWNVIPPCGLSKCIIPNFHVVPFFFFRHPKLSKTKLRGLKNI